MPIHGYAALRPGTSLEPFSWEPGPLGADEVEIAVEVCGLCHSDVSMIHNEWGLSRYPLVPGHEVVGEIVRVGSAAHGLRRGQRVGVGWQMASCGTCEYCQQGDEAFCGVAKRDTIVHGYGGFAECVRVDHRFAIPIPETIDSAHAGPLMCGGITVFTPLADYGVRAGMRTAVVGMGGLGHLAIQFLAALGTEVTVFSTSRSKEADARAFGAHDFIATGEEGALAAWGRKFDFILNTVSGDLPWNEYLAMLRPRGSFVLVGFPTRPLELSPVPLILHQARVGGSPIGSPQNLRRMLDFAAMFKIAPAIQRRPLAQVNEALSDLCANRARYRYVLDVQT